jgi:protease I
MLEDDIIVKKLPALEQGESTMRLQGKTIAYLVAQEVEDLEFWVPVMRLREEGAKVIIIGLTKETVRGKHGLEMTPDISIEEAPEADALDGLVIPGGWAPDKLRRNQGVLRLVRDMYARKKIIASICHAGWVPISAGIVRGHKATGSTAIKDDITNAGGIWVNEAAFREDNLVWGRVVEDIPAFCRELVAALSE